MKSTRQVSRIKTNDNHEEFSLGRFYPPRRGLFFHRNLNYLTTEFFDGAYCDLIGKLRSSRIRFVCANDKMGMYVANVVETSACVYDFVIHIPELCEYLTKHSEDEKQISRVNCFNYSEKAPKSTEGQRQNVKNERLDGLDQILGLIESSYKDSSILKDYKKLLTKATEKLKSDRLSKDISRPDSDEAPFLDLLTRLTENSEKEPEEKDESESKVKNNLK